MCAAVSLDQALLQAEPVLNAVEQLEEKKKKKRIHRWTEKNRAQFERCKEGKRRADNRRRFERLKKEAETRVLLDEELPIGVPEIKHPEAWVPDASPPLIRQKGSRKSKKQAPIKHEDAPAPES